MLLGVNDTAPTRWDGTFSGQRVGTITATEWKFAAGDNIDGQLFHLSTRPDARFAGSAGAGATPVVPNGLILTADRVTESSEFQFTTAQGDFPFRASDVVYGKGIYKLGGRVYIDRVPPASGCTNTPEEEDYPPLRRIRWQCWLAYVQFHHSPDHMKSASRLAWSAQEVLRIYRRPPAAIRSGCEVFRGNLATAHRRHQGRQGSVPHSGSCGWKRAGMGFLVGES